jgi:multidrug resistance efflux pump
MNAAPRVAGLLLAAGVAVSASGCGRTTADVADRHAPSDAPDVVCLGYADVEGGSAALRPERPGRVVEVLVQEGDEVKENQELFRLEDGEQRQEVARAEAGVKAALAREALAKQEAKQHAPRLKQLGATLEATTSRLAGARITLKRQEELFGRSLVSKEDVDLAHEQVRELEASVAAAKARLSEASAVDPQLSVSIAAAEVESAQARLGQARHALSACVLRAPSAGCVLTLAVRLGEVVGQPGQAAPVLFCPQAPFVVRAEVEQELVSLVQPRQEARVRDEMAGTGPWKGTVVRVGRLYSRRRHRTDPTQFVDVPTVECLVRLESGHPPLRIGQKLRVSLYGKAPGS